MKAIIAAIVTFFTSIFSPAATPPALPPSPTPAATPLPTPSYPRQTYTNNTLRYSLLYPANTSINQAESATTAWDDTYTLRFDAYQLANPSLEILLDIDLMCNANGPMGSVSCKNTAVRPLTNQAGTEGFLIRRTKTITGGAHAGEYKDTAYVFPLHTSPAPALILSVEYPSADNLQILADTANWFTTLP